MLKGNLAEWIKNQGKLKKMAKFFDIMARFIKNDNPPIRIVLKDIDVFQNPTSDISSQFMCLIHYILKNPNVLVLDCSSYTQKQFPILNPYFIEKITEEHPVKILFGTSQFHINNIQQKHKPKQPAEYYKAYIKFCRQYYISSDLFHENNLLMLQKEINAILLNCKPINMNISKAREHISNIWKTTKKEGAGLQELQFCFDALRCNCLTVAPPTTEFLLHRIGIIYYDAGKYNLAISYLTQAVAITEDPYIFYALSIAHGMKYFKAKNYPKAVGYYLESMRYSSQEVRYQTIQKVLSLADSFCKKGQYNFVILCYHKMLTLDFAEINKKDLINKINFIKNIATTKKNNGLLRLCNKALAASRKSNRDEEVCSPNKRRKLVNSQSLRPVQPQSPQFNYPPGFQPPPFYSSPTGSSLNDMTRFKPSPPPSPPFGW